MTPGLFDELNAAQAALIDALGKADTDTIVESTREVARLTEKLRLAGEALGEEAKIDGEARRSLEALAEGQGAIAHRIRFMRDHIRMRLALLQGDGQDAIYGDRRPRRPARH